MSAPHVYVSCDLEPGQSLRSWHSPRTRSRWERFMRWANRRA